MGGSIVVPYRANRITYRYDRENDRYVRGVTGAKTQRDWTTKAVVAPSNVVVLFMGTGQLRNDALGQANEKKHRLDIRYIGTGKALVFRDGQVIKATWSKKNDNAPTRFLYASGPLKGEPIPLVRGQIAIQVVPRAHERHLEGRQAGTARRRADATAGPRSGALTGSQAGRLAAA